MTTQLHEEQLAAHIAQATAAAAAVAGVTARMTTRTITSSVHGGEEEAEEGWGNETNGGARAGTGSKNKKTSVPVNAKIYAGHLDKVLSEESVREDFVDIVRDLEDRAVSYTKKHVCVHCKDVFNQSFS